jgi:hypothetical protein
MLFPFFSLLLLDSYFLLFLIRILSGPFISFFQQLMTRIDLQEAGKTAEGTSRTLHASEMRNEISIGLLNAYKNREQYSTKDSIKDFDLVCGVLSIAGRSQILNGGAVTSTDIMSFN